LTLLEYRPVPGRLTLPDVCCDLLWFDERVFVVGPLSRAIEAIGVGQHVSVLRLDPQVARQWLGVPLHQLANRVIALEDIDRRVSSTVAAQFEAGGASAIVGADWLPAELSYTRVREARIRLGHGERVGAAASTIGMSERQLERLFADVTGLTPRAYTRILRFRRAIFAAGRGARLASVALDAGYADQAHLCRDVRDLTGHSPRMLLGHVGNIQDIVAGAL
jgi:AraC-like DNA-binding protein